MNAVPATNLSRVFYNMWVSSCQYVTPHVAREAHPTLRVFGRLEFIILESARNAFYI